MTRSTAIDSTYIKAQRSAFGGKGGSGAGDRALARPADHQGPALTDVIAALTR